MMLMAFCGDPHGDFRSALRFSRENPDIPLVLLGDMNLEEPLSSVLPRSYWIPGNHDFDRETYYAPLLDDRGAAAGCLHGRILRIGDLRVAGLGGNFQERIWNPKSGDGKPNWRCRVDFIRAVRPQDRWRAKMLPDPWFDRNATQGAASDRWPGLPLKARGAIWPEDYERLADLRADILVTHEAPTTHRHGFEEIDLLAEAMGVKLVVHGHHHTDYDTVLPSGIRVISVGKATVTIVEVDA